MSLAETNIGVVGLGNIGGSIAERLLERGYGVRAFDVDPKAVERVVAAGGSAVSSAAEAAESDLLLSSLPTDDLVMSVLGNEALLERLSGRALIDLSTILPQTIRGLAERARRHEVQVIDAPISGGKAEARAGAVTFFVGSDAALGETAKGVLDALGSTELVGAVGHGKALKLVNNVMSIGNMVVAVEAFELGKRAGLSPERMFEIVSHSGGSSRMFVKRMPRILEDDYAATFSLGLSAKDLRLALELAQSTKLDMSVAGGVSDTLNRGVEQGLSAEDLSAVAKILRD